MVARILDSQTRSERQSNTRAVETILLLLAELMERHLFSMKTTSQGRIQDSMLGGGAQYLKSRVFSRERRRLEAMLGGSGGMLPLKILDKNGAIRCILVHSMAHFSLHYFAVFEVIFFF